ncbi:hypothetical protein M3P19_09690 [Muricauda sp. 2012CJ35-5]|uniref:Glycosyltransferase RgtA/B/C/D-like domain-containing protein n=1 Tax=Flagellimonas spongiicola TaxID=2942208 RepID=A0ABT0PUA3_9FLAO|nr:hypothetical protein [Allomuricauda spongiicola]MCL6274282.1 hypothetical protein [Allomuricauda spongiicola]
MAIVAFFGFLGFMIQPTAFTWGEQDMMPFLERFFNPEFLAEDFFTNSTVIKNPRWVYGYFLVTIVKFSGISWYKVLYVLKLCFQIIAPILYYKVIVVIAGKFIEPDKLRRMLLFILPCLVLMVFLKEYRYYFSVGSWSSYNPYLHAYNISIVFGFLAIFLKEKQYRPIAYIPLFILSCFFHPAMGLYTMAFYIVFLLPDFKKHLKEIQIIFFTGIISVFMVKFLFAGETVLSTKEFIDIYVKERHPWHYSVPDFNNLKGDWRVIFTWMNILFLAPILIGIYKKNKNVWLVSLVAWIFYVMAIFCQYVFIDVLPVKLFAYLGVSRFTTFGYWMLLIIWSITISLFINEKKQSTYPSLGKRNFTFIIFTLVFVGIIFIDDPIEERRRRQWSFYEFVKSTDNNSVFTTYSAKMNTDIRLVGLRAVFIGDEFPFSEEDILEYGDRRRLMYGSYQNGDYGSKYYRKLKPKDFVKIAGKYKLDYIVIEKKYSSQFGNSKPVWENHKNQIYKLSSLKQP